VDFMHIVAGLDGHYPLVAWVIVTFFLVKQVPWLIAAFCAALAGTDDDLERARKALEARSRPAEWCSSLRVSLRGGGFAGLHYGAIAAGMATSCLVSACSCGGGVGMSLAMEASDR
jgi:hypothetical protein